MDVSRIKTITVAVLVMINILFGAVIVIDTIADARANRLTIEYACDALHDGGIAIDADSIISNGAIRTMRTARQDESEAMIAQAVLGETTMTDHGVIFLYENAQRGTAEFYSAGDFEIRLKNTDITNENGSLRTVLELLDKMGVETASQVVSYSEGTETVTVIDAYKGISIFNCATEFIFRDGSLQMIAGRYVTGVEPDPDGTEITHAATALLSFLSWVRLGNADCARIDKVEAGYRHRVSGSFGEGVIAPAWLITADSGRYIIDDDTGEILPIT
ncbi:MAG: hypothetical protein FWH57_08400 [Oscillospiraceae bacterium]|nr:hypothetical protein [Oscillospiraceae bacterium]